MMNSIKFIVIFLLLGMSVSPGLAKSIRKTYSAREIYQAISGNFQMSEGDFFDYLPTGILEEDPFLPFCFVGYVYATYNLPEYSSKTERSTSNHKGATFLMAANSSR